MKKTLLYIPKISCKLVLPKFVWDPFLSIDDSGISNFGKATEFEDSEIVKVRPCSITFNEKIYSYILVKSIDDKFIIDSETFEAYFRPARKSFWQIDICYDKAECNKLLESLDIDCLKDIKEISHDRFMVIYKIKGDVEKDNNGEVIKCNNGEVIHFTSSEIYGDI